MNTDQRRVRASLAGFGLSIWAVLDGGQAGVIEIARHAFILNGSCRNYCHGPYVIKKCHKRSTDANMTCHVNMTPNGRLSLPVEPRKRLGLAIGGPLLIDETEDGFVLRTVAQSVAHAQALMSQCTENSVDVSVDAFLANRRSDSGE